MSNNRGEPPKGLSPIELAVLQILFRELRKETRG